MKTKYSQVSYNFPSINGNNTGTEKLMLIVPLDHLLNILQQNICLEIYEFIPNDRYFVYKFIPNDMIFHI